MELKLRICDIYTKHNRENDMGEVSLYMKHIKKQRPFFQIITWNNQSVSSIIYSKSFFFFYVFPQIDYIGHGLIGCQEDRNQQEDSEP